MRPLVEKGVEADSKDKYRKTPLSWAAAEAHEAVVQLLRSYGVGSLSLHSGRPSTGAATMLTRSGDA